MFLAVDRFELGGVGLLHFSDLGLDIRWALGADRHVVADRAKEALEMGGRRRVKLPATVPCSSAVSADEAGVALCVVAILAESLVGVDLG